MSRKFWKMSDIAPPLDPAVKGHRDIFGSDPAPAPAPPNYAPMQAASDYAAELGLTLGREQIAESKRQYDLNRAVSDQVVNKQLALMDQTKTQGDDYYNYMANTFRPLEQQMVTTANNEASVARQEEVAAQAAADARRGSTQQQNQLIRQGLRYGWSPQRLASMAGSMAGSQAAQVASATTNARNNQRNLGWARQMDAAGLGRNLAGASQGAYGLTINSGNSAVANSMQPGSQLLTGMAQGAGMQQTGVGQQLGGLGGILNAQGSYNNMLANYNSQNQGGGMFGALLGAGAQLGSAYMTSGMWKSDPRLKENVALVGYDERTDLGIYEFEYINGDGTRYRGVMADEVEAKFPDAVAYNEYGFAGVNYDMLGMKMEVVGHAVD